MADDPDFVRVAVATEFAVSSSLIGQEEYELAMAGVPDVILQALRPSDNDMMLFLREYADRTITLWRLMAGNINSPLAVATGTIQ